MSGGVTVLAGGAIDLAFRVGLAMALLQLGIGTVNDLVDAPSDAGLKPGKPIPAGLIPVAAARTLAVVVFASGFLLAGSVSLPVGLLAVAVIAIGLAYDLRLKGTAWSWLPFAVGIPILPVFGWVAATGTLHALFSVLLPAAVAAGAALAIGNALVDVERDRAAGITSIAVALGLRRAPAMAATLFGLVWLLAWASAAIAGRGVGPATAVAVVGAVPVIAAARSGGVPSDRRERLWQVEALASAVLAIAWLAIVLGPA